MAYEGSLKIVPGLTAGADLSSDQYKFGKVSAGGVVLANVSGEPVDGVIQDKPSVAGRAVSLAYDGVTKIEAGGIITAGARIQPNALGLAITAAAAASAAHKDSAAGTFNMAAGDTLVLDVDNVGAATATFDAAAGTITDTTGYAVANQDGLTVLVSVDGGANQTVTFPATGHTTALEIAASMNAGLIGCGVNVAGGQVVVTSDSQGTGSTIAITAGTSALTWGAAVAGTGDVVDIDAVTAAEVKTVVDADTTAVCTVNADGSVTFTSPSTGTASELDFQGGNVITTMSLAVEVINGAASGTHFAGKALEAATASGDIISALLINGLNV